MFINHSSKQVTAKIVYYGPGLSGKTSNLQYIFSITNPKSRGELVSIETDIERTLFFDLLPINVGQIQGYQTKFQLYTVPGQVFYDSTRKLVLKGADGIVFIADSQELMESANTESLDNLRINLENQNQDITKIPLVLQYNKRDLKNVATVERMNQVLNKLDRPYFSACAINGKGVIETLREISGLTLRRIKQLIDHTLKVDNVRPLSVKFDTNKKQKIIKREELPVKKIHVETKENYDQQIVAKPEDLTNNAAKAAKAEIRKPTPLEPLVTMEYNRFEDTASFPTLNGFDMKEPDRPGKVSPPTVPTGAAAEKAETLPGVKPGTPTPPTKPAPPSASPPPSKTSIPFEETKPSEPAQPTEAEKKTAPMPLSETPKPPQKISQPPEAGKNAQPNKTDKTTDKTDKIKDTEDNKDNKQKTKKKDPPPSSLAILDQFKDTSRITVIKKLNKLPKENSPITIQIKDNENNLLEPIEVQLTPGVKKITLILDVKT